MSLDKSESQKTLPFERISQGQRWLHYKGGEYEIVALGVKEDTGEQMVVYRSIAYGSVWIRSICNWFETVATSDGRTLPRFKLKEA